MLDALCVAAGNQLTIILARATIASLLVADKLLVLT